MRGMNAKELQESIFSNPSLRKLKLCYLGTVQKSHLLVLELAVNLAMESYNPFLQVEFRIRPFSRRTLITAHSVEERLKHRGVHLYNDRCV
jgi:hypothetical protein